MKKILALCSVIVCVSLMLTLFVSCGKDKDTEPTDESTAKVISVTNGEFIFNAEIGEDNTVIKNGGEEYQVLNYPSNTGHVFDLAYAKEHAEFVDMNFDGQPDFYIAVSKNGETINYYCWLFNATTKKFEPSEMLTALTNISVDAYNHIIYSTQYLGDEVKVVEYVWVNGQLTYKEVYDNEKDTIPEEVTEAVQQNAIGTETKPEKSTTQPTDDTKTTTTAKKPDGNKTTSSKTSAPSTTETKNPPITTTTAPHRDGIVIESGNVNDGWY